MNKVAPNVQPQSTVIKKGDTGNSQSLHTCFFKVMWGTDLTEPQFQCLKIEQCYQLPRAIVMTE